MTVKKLSETTRMSLCIALLCISSYLVIPLPFTPIALTTHTIVVNITGLTLKPRNATTVVLIYIFMGLIGIPVFSGGGGGVPRLIGPTGGFYFGFLFSIGLISHFKGSKASFLRYLAVTILIGLPVQHLFAVLFMCFYNGFNIKAAFLSASLPFIIGDVVKCGLSVAISLVLHKKLTEM